MQVGVNVCRYGGLCQAGWQCASKIEKEPRRDILLISYNYFFLYGYILSFLRVSVFFFVFFLAKRPYDPISNEVFSTIHHHHLDVTS